MMATLDIKIYNNDVIENLAEAVLSHIGYDNVCAVDIVQVANKLGLNVYTKILEDSSGYIKIEGSEKNIYVNELESSKRKRFTIAHEIGHFLLHRNLITNEQGTVLYRSCTGFNRDMIEIQANRCAAALLMPKKLLLEKFRDLECSSFQKIPILAENFKVSIDAMYTRLSTLGAL